jgi:hypothetical protein
MIETSKLVLGLNRFRVEHPLSVHVPHYPDKQHIQHRADQQQGTLMRPTIFVRRFSAHQR